MMEGEALYCVDDRKGAGTGFIAITDKRLMFYDKAFLRKKKALTSVPFGGITSVSAVDGGRGLLGSTSELVVKSGTDEHEYEFRGGEKAQSAYKFMMKHLLS